MARMVRCTPAAIGLHKTRCYMMWPALVWRSVFLSNFGNICVLCCCTTRRSIRPHQTTTFVLCNACSTQTHTHRDNKNWFSDELAIQFFRFGCVGEPCFCLRAGDSARNVSRITYLYARNVSHVSSHPVAKHAFWCSLCGVLMMSIVCARVHLTDRAAFVRNTRSRA